jgi:hypothetical protein
MNNRKRQVDRILKQAKVEIITCANCRTTTPGTLFKAEGKAADGKSFEVVVCRTCKDNIPAIGEAVKRAKGNG